MNVNAMILHLHYNMSDMNLPATVNHDDPLSMIDRNIYNVEYENNLIYVYPIHPDPEFCDPDEYYLSIAAYSKYPPKSNR